MAIKINFTKHTRADGATNYALHLLFVTYNCKFTRQNKHETEG